MYSGVTWETLNLRPMCNEHFVEVSVLWFDVEATFGIVAVSYIGECALEVGNVKLC